MKTARIIKSKEYWLCTRMFLGIAYSKKCYYETFETGEKGTTKLE